MTARRFIPRLLFCLALGLVTTVAVAWISAASVVPTVQTAPFYTLNTPMHNPEFGGYRFSTSHAQRITWGPFSYGGSYSIAIDPVTHKMIDPDGMQIRWAKDVFPEFEKRRLFPPSWGRAPRIERTGNASRNFRWVQDARGWPMLAAWCEWQDDAKSRGLGPVEGGIDLPKPRFAFPDEFAVRALPYRPIPLGLAADTLIFAFAWSALLSAPRAIRRRIRLSRNQCPRCAYNLAGLPANSRCPECGHTHLSRASNTEPRP